MNWALRIPLSIVILAAVGCAPSAPTTNPSQPSTAITRSRVTWLKDAMNAGGTHTATAVKTSAVIDGFRVHPDPGDDGVIRITADQSVAVNATDIASRPPAPPSFLVVNWGDGPNQRVGCGPCRADHSYGVGRYTLVASADNLQPSAGSGTDRSITVVVEVAPTSEKRELGPIQPFLLLSSDVAVGDTLFIRVPLDLPPGVSVDFVDLPCTPPGAAYLDFGNEVFVPPDLVDLPFVGVAPGTCTFVVSGDNNGTPFTQSATFTIH